MGKFNLVSLRFKNKSKLTGTQVEFNSQTPENDWGQNSIYYLDRHDVKCSPNEALQGFRLFRPQNNKLAYKFACIKNSNLVIANSFYDSKTPENAIAGNDKRSANYLDRHSIHCNQGYALQRFKLDRINNSNRSNIYYSYRCVKVECGPIQSMSTQKTSDGGHETIYLDRQDVRVKNDEVITGFKLVSVGGNYSYTVNFCKLTAPAITVAQTPVSTLTPREKRQNFCKNNCVYNPIGEKKLCKLATGEFPCRRCIVKPLISDSNVKYVCNNFCNSKVENDSCAFYGFTNNLIKNYDPNIIKNLDISLADK